MRKALDGVWEHPAARVLEDTPSLPQQVYHKRVADHKMAPELAGVGVPQ
ncbi:hypothetical protein [Thermus aquaticus]|nr:hypothetical protein [Thermus aquaticus]